MRMTVVLVVLAGLFFTASPSIAQMSKIVNTERFIVIEVDPEKKRPPQATVYDADSKLLGVYPVAAQNFGPDFVRKLPFRGVVERIGYKEGWNPTDATRKAMANVGKALPEGHIPYGHARNAMGIGFIRVSWAPCGRSSLSCVDSSIGLHGTITPAEIGKYISRGCYRFHDEHWLEVRAAVTGYRTEVHVVPFGHVWLTQSANAD